MNHCTIVFYPLKFSYTFLLSDPNSNFDSQGIVPTIFLIQNHPRILNLTVNLPAQLKLRSRDLLKRPRLVMFFFIIRNHSNRKMPAFFRYVVKTEDFPIANRASEQNPNR